MLGRGSPSGPVRQTIRTLRLHVPRSGPKRVAVRSALSATVFICYARDHHRLPDVHRPVLAGRYSSSRSGLVLLALGLNVVVGFAGLLDLGFVAFYAIGAYTTAWVTGRCRCRPRSVHLNSFCGSPVAIVMAMSSGVIARAPTLRLRGDYLAIVTLGFGEII